MYAPDLATSCLVAQGPNVRAIGWLEHGQPFITAPVDEHVLSVLRAHVDDLGHWQPFWYGGFHTCDLGGCERDRHGEFIVIPSSMYVYVAPSLIVHYVAHHHYAPPSEFVEALLSCPEQSSDSYVERLLPFGSVWELDASEMRSIAATARQHRARILSFQELARIARTPISTWRIYPEAENARRVIDSGTVTAAPSAHGAPMSATDFPRRSDLRSFVDRFVDGTGVPDDQASYIVVAMRDVIGPLQQLIRSDNVASASAIAASCARDEINHGGLENVDQWATVANDMLAVSPAFMRLNPEEREQLADWLLLCAAVIVVLHNAHHRDSSRDLAEQLLALPLLASLG